MEMTKAAPYFNLTPEDSPRIAQRLMEHLHRGGAHGYYWTYPDKVTHWHAVGNNGRIPQSERVYFGVNPTSTSRDRNQRARIEDIAAINCAYADFDAKDFGGDMALVKDHIYDLRPAPNVIVNSGGGYHCYWLFDEPFVIRTEIDRTRAIKLQADWVRYVGGDNGAKDLARVLRVPGTTNGKYDPPRPVVVEYADFVDLCNMAMIESKCAHLLSAVTPKIEAKSTMHERMVNGPSSATSTDEAGRIRQALAALRPSRADEYAEWLAVGMALREVSGGLALWHEWSKQSSKYDAEATDKKWQTLKPSRTGVGAIFNKLKEDSPDVWEQLKPRRSDMIVTDTKINPDEVEQFVGMTSQANGNSNAVVIDDPRTLTTDTQNSTRFARQHRGRACYVDQWGWVAYDGARWQIDKTHAATRLAKATAKSIYAEAAEAQGDKAMDALAAWAKASHSHGKLTAMLALARSELPARVEDFDKDPYLFNVQNGIVDLRTGHLQAHSPEKKLMRIAQVKYDPAAQCPTWLAFLNRIMAGDAEMIAFIQRAIGCTLSGVTEKAFFFLYGPDGNNGKSTLTETISELLGDYSGRLNVDTLLSQKRDAGGYDDIAGTIGKRMITTSELDERRMSEKLIKDITGNDTIKAKFMGQSMFEFRPAFKLWMFGNHKPTIKDSGNSMWERLKVIPFLVSIPEGERDTSLPDRLRGEFSGILNWAIAGCMAWQRDGLRPPAKVKEATASYRAEQDTLTAFIDECCVQGIGNRVAARNLYDAYLRETNDHITSIEFGKRLKRQGFVQGRMPDGSKAWMGLMLN